MLGKVPGPKERVGWVRRVGLGSEGGQKGGGFHTVIEGGDYEECRRW
jgi:hypothetical protein